MSRSDKTISNHRLGETVRWFIWSIIGLFLVLTITVAFFTQAPGEKLLTVFLEKQLSIAIDQEVHIGALETNLFTRLQISNLRVQSPPKVDATDLLSLEQGKINYQPLSILSRKFIIESAELSGLRVNIVRDSSGTYNLPQVSTSEKPDSLRQPASVPVILRRLTLDYGKASFTDNSGEIPAVKMLNFRTMINFGPDSTYHCEVQIDTNRFLYRESVVDVTDLRLLCRYSGSKFSLEGIQCRLPGMTLSGTGSAALKEDDPSLHAELKIVGNPAELADRLSVFIPDAILPLHGDVDLELALSGNLSNPTIATYMISPSLNIGVQKLDTLRLNALFLNRTCEIKELSTQMFRGRCSLAGNIQMDSLYSYQVSTSVSGIDLASVWSLIYGGTSLYKGQLDGYLKAQGDLRDYKKTALDADIRLSNLKYRDKRIDDFKAGVNIEGGKAQFSFTGEDVRGKGVLKVQKRNLSGHFTADLNQLNPLAGFLNQPTLKGNLQVLGNISGSVDNPEIDTRFEAKQVRYQNIPVDSVRSRLAIRSQQVFIDDLTFGGGLTVSDSTQLPFKTRDLTGSIAYSGSLRGNLENLQGDITITLLDPGYQKLSFDEGMVHLSLSDQKIRLSPLELIRDTLCIQLVSDFDLNTYAGTAVLLVFNQRTGTEHGASSGTSQLDTLVRSDLKYDLTGLNQISLFGDLNVDNVAYLSAFLPEHPEIGGSLQLHVKVSGVPGDPNGEVRFNLHKAQLGTAQLDSIRGMIVLNADHIAVPSIEFFLKNHRSWIATHVDLIRDEDRKPIISGECTIRGEAYGDNFPLAVINPLLPYGYSLSGCSSHSLVWGGTISNPHPSGTIKIENGKVTWGAAKPEFHDLFIDLTLQPSAVETNRFDGYLGNIPFNLDATVITPDHRDFDLDVDLKISDIGLLQTKGRVSRENIAVQLKSQQLNLASLQPFFPTLPQLAGVLNTEITVNGSPLDPEIGGYIDMRDLILHPAPFSERFSDGIVRIHFDRNSVHVDSLYLRMGQGWVLSQGTLAFDELMLTRIDLNTTMRNIKYQKSKDWNLAVKTADLRYHGGPDNFHLEGDITLGKSKVLVNFQPQALLPFTRSVERPVPSLPDFMTKTQLDIRVRDTEELWLDNNIARLRLHPELEFIGSAAQINLAGRLVIEEGYVLFLDRKFKIYRGVIDFIDPVRINPIVDIQAVATIRNYQAMEMIPYDVTLKISGFMDQPIVELTSDPVLEQADIVSLLTLGATREQLTGSSLEHNDPSKTDILLDRAGELSSRKISGYLSKNIASIAGLDDVNIEGNLFRFGKSWGPQLVASKRITDRMEVTYTTNVGHFNEKSVRVDYRLSKYFWIESETDQRGKAGLDLKYKIKLK